MTPVSDFEQVRIPRALKVIEQILETTKNPTLIDDVDHEYDDKYSVTEFMTNTALASILNVLENLEGFNEDILKNMIDCVKEKRQAVTLRMSMEKHSEFLEEKTVQVESPTFKTEIEQIKHSKDKNEGKEISTTVETHKIVNEVKEYHWKVTIQHSLILIPGTDQEKVVTLGSHKGTTTIITRMNKNPFPNHLSISKDINVTKLFEWNETSNMKCCFAIDREQATTPRRNKEVDEVIEFLQKLAAWSRECSQSLIRALCVKIDEVEQLYSISQSAQNVLVPILPILLPSQNGSQPRPQIEGSQKDSSDDDKETSVVEEKRPTGTSALISVQDTSRFLAEQCNSLQLEIQKLKTTYPTPSSENDEQVVTSYEATLVLLWFHLEDIAIQCNDGIQYIENVLRKQLVQAIGKEVNCKEFHDFLKFHNQRIFANAYSPKPFCYAIRQTMQYPDGSLSIVSGGPYSKDPIDTFVRKLDNDSLSMSIPLNAATNVQFVGDQYLHGWIDTHFASELTPKQYHLTARARQFSCFLLAIGKISGPNEFTPQDAIILQNKDEVLIPVLLTALPSAKEFKDATKSLSPEQARFAKSFRVMQLDTSVFGLCVIQIKPQLETLLNLPINSLTKEIQLTQDLLSAFVEYQIPPTLMSYDGSESVSAPEKVISVKAHVKAVLDVIQDIKDKQLKEEVQKADMHAEKCSMPLPMTMPFVAPIELSYEGMSFDGGNIEGDIISLEEIGIQRGSCVPEAATARVRCLAPPGLGGLAPPVVMSAPAPPASKVCFGALASATNTSTSLFGNTTTPAPAAGGLFGAQAPSTSLFGASDMSTARGDFEILSQNEDNKEDSSAMLSEEDQTDFTAIPKQWDKMFESFDTEHALRTTILSTGDKWKRKRQQNLLTKLQESTMSNNDKKSETNRALDLLDALSCSGSIPIVSGELHVIIGVRHSFEQSAMDTIIRKNMNPIEKMDFSSLLIAASIHQTSIETLIADSSEKPAMILEKRFPPKMILQTADANVGEE